ncbi:unnamed protein product [Protopolystoma xenopodis]|uniref:Uncharacterized protein n=1 Tax=Protopolystoma xenopodis TaxID=117903 RepID=A0A3S5ACS5_9PLAT|nr:unnamed protein product [Protopolystoma xenopodis]
MYRVWFLSGHVLNDFESLPSEANIQAAGSSSQPFEEATEAVVKFTSACAELSVVSCHSASSTCQITLGFDSPLTKLGSTSLNPVVLDDRGGEEEFLTKEEESFDFLRKADKLAPSAQVHICGSQLAETVRESVFELDPPILPSLPATTQAMSQPTFAPRYASAFRVPVACATAFSQSAIPSLPITSTKAGVNTSSTFPNRALEAGEDLGHSFSSCMPSSLNRPSSYNLFAVDTTGLTGLRNNSEISTSLPMHTGIINASNNVIVNAREIKSTLADLSKVEAVELTSGDGASAFAAQSRPAGQLAMGLRRHLLVFSSLSELRLLRHWLTVQKQTCENVEQNLGKAPGKNESGGQEKENSMANSEKVREQHISYFSLAFLFEMTWIRVLLAGFPKEYS